MLVRTSLCALAIVAAATPAFAGDHLRVGANAGRFAARSVSAGAQPPARLDIARGLVSLQNSQQQARVRGALPRIQQAVATQLDHPETLELRNLRTGRYLNVMVVCGTVDSQSPAGAVESRRFIARPSVATLETPANSQSFQQGWKATGCGF